MGIPAGERPIKEDCIFEKIKANYTGAANAGRILYIPINHIEKIECEYCGRKNNLKREKCKSCGANL